MNEIRMTINGLVYEKPSSFGRELPKSTVVIDSVPWTSFVFEADGFAKPVYVKWSHVLVAQEKVPARRGNASRVRKSSMKQSRSRNGRGRV